MNNKLSDFIHAGKLMFFSFLLPFSLQVDGMEACSASENSAVLSVSGPVLNLDYSRGCTNDVPMADLMYFVALISPETVILSQSPTNTLRIKAASIRREDRKDKPGHFSATLTFEVIGSGFMHYVIDHAAEIQRRKGHLAAGKVIEKQLDYIRYEGPAQGSLDIEGTVEGGEKIVSTVRLRLRNRDAIGPVTIGLRNVRLVDDQLKYENELVARVGLLEFKRSDRSPRMGVDIGSVNRKDACSSFYQNFKGRVIGVVATMLVGSVVIEKAGNDAMLGFGHALLNRIPSFEFPFAKNLKLATAPDF